MVKLKDYLGTLLSGVNQARVLADIESAKIAQAYASDEIMKNFPIPRFRAQDIELDIPIAIDSFDEQPVKDYQPISNQNFNSLAYFSMKDQAKVKSFSRKTSTLLNSKISEYSRILEKDLKADISKEKAYSAYEKKMGDTFLEALRMEKIPVENQEEMKLNFQSTLKSKVYETVTPKRATNQMENANVIVEATQLREIPNENIVRIKMKLVEDGMEWHTSQDADGRISSKLLPE